MAKLIIHSIANKGNLENECVWLKAEQDVADLSFYVVSDTTYTDDNHISNELRHIYWFKKQAVRASDWIQLMTKKGKPTSTKNNDGTTTHTIYWGLDRTVWNKDGDCVVLFELNTWLTKRG